MVDDLYTVNGKNYTRTTQNRRQLKLKEWGINESIYRETLGSSAEKVYPERKFFFNTDSYGFIDNENDIKSEEKIAILSGSYVECMFMQPKERMISRMERRLNEKLHTHRRSVQCMNCAMSGMHILHALFVLLAKIIPINVNAVVYVIDINEYRASSMSDGGYYTMHKNLSIYTTSKDSPSRKKINYTHFRKFIRDFWSICKIHGIRCIFVGRTYANCDSRSSANKVARKVCESLKCDYIDIGENIKANYNPAPEDYDEYMNSLTYDGTHLTPCGASIVGDALADEVYRILFEERTNMERA